MATTVTDSPGPLQGAALVPGRLARLAAPLSSAAIVVGATVALHFRDPHVQGSWGVCPTALLGFDCPACGSLRAVYHLTNVDLLAAASSNLLLVLFAPVGLLLWLRRARGAWLGGAASRPLHVPSAGWVLVAITVVAFTIARNLPPGAWLHS